MSVIDGDLEVRMLTFAKNSVDRKALFTFTLSSMEDSVEGYEGEQTGDLHQEVSAFLASSLNGDKLNGFAVRQLISLYNRYADANDGNFSSELMKLGSSISILYVQQSEDEMVREFVSFLFTLSENSGNAPEGMTTYLVGKYIRVLCNYTIRALNEYCTAHNF